MDANRTSFSFKQANVAKPNSSVEATLLSHDGKTIERLLKENQVTTYLGKMNTYEARMRVLDTRGETIGSDFLQNVTLDISPARNGAGVLTTINGTYFDDPEAGGHPMQFVDVKNENSNPIQFALWDPYFESYNFSMTVQISGRTYTLKRHIIVQTPLIEFLGNQSECNSLYNQTSNFINSTCSSVYNISASYDMKYRFLQIYKNTSGNVSSSSVYSFLNVSNPLLYWTQNSTHATRQEFDDQASDVVPSGANVQAVGHMGLAYFSAPYLSPKTCYPNVTDTTQIFKASAYDYATSIENYLLVKGTQEKDQWVPLRKSDVTIILGGSCPGEDPCGMGLVRNYTKPWSLKNSSFSPHDDSKWCNGTAAVPPTWNGTTGNIQGKEKKLCVTTYVTADGEASDPSHIYWYFCNFTTTSFDSGGMGNGVFLPELRGTNNLFAGKPPEDQVIKASPGVPANYSLYLGSNESPWYFGPNTPLNITKTLSEIHNMTGHDSDGDTYIFVVNEYDDEPGRLVPVVVSLGGEKKLVRACTTARKAKKGSRRSLFLFFAGALAIGSSAVKSVKKESEEKDDDDEDDKSPIIEVTNSAWADELSVVYNQTGNLNYIESLTLPYEVSVRNADKLKADRAFGVSCIIDKGSLVAKSGASSSPYLVYDLSGTGDKKVQDVKTIKSSGGSSQKISTTCTLVFPKLYTVPAYASQCKLFNDYNIIQSYQWSVLTIYSQVFTKTSSDGPWIFESEARIVKTNNDVNLTCSSAKGCGFGIDSYTRGWTLSQDFAPTDVSSTYISQNEFQPTKNAQGLEEGQRYVREYIRPTALNEQKNEQEEEFWVMCPVKSSSQMFAKYQATDTEDLVHGEIQESDFLHAESYLVEIM